MVPRGSGRRAVGDSDPRPPARRSARFLRGMSPDGTFHTPKNGNRGQLTRRGGMREGEKTGDVRWRGWAGGVLDDRPGGGRCQAVDAGWPVECMEWRWGGDEAWGTAFWTIHTVDGLVDGQTPGGRHAWDVGRRGWHGGQRGTWMHGRAARWRAGGRWDGLVDGRSGKWTGARISSAWRVDRVAQLNCGCMGGIDRSIACAQACTCVRAMRTYGACAGTVGKLESRS